MIRFYKFGNGITEGRASDKEILGGKGANLQEMSSMGLNVPAGFTIPTKYTFDKITLSNLNDVMEQMNHIQGDLDYMPLVSIRSGASVSMPGMMESILNVGLTKYNLPFWSKKLTRKVAYDSYCRLIRMMGETIHSINPASFDCEVNEIMGKYGVKSYYDLHATGFSALSSRFKKLYYNLSGLSFPDDIETQLYLCISAVFNSWNAPKAKKYREIHNIPDDIGTACTIQKMVFGNMNNNSMTGVLFTRNPNSGVKLTVGEFLVNAQGEDVVNGSVTPINFKKMYVQFPKVHKELMGVCKELENHYNDMQDIEFTVQDGELFILQTRTGKRTAEAAFRIVRDLYTEGLITKAQVLERITSAQYFAMRVPVIDPSFKVKPDHIGLAAGGPVVSGMVVTSSAMAVKFKGDCILVTEHTTPDDVAGMNASKGILTRTGGMTCHAAVVGRGMNKTCVVGASDLPDHLDGQKITIEGSTGKVWIGIDVPVISDEGDTYGNVGFFEGILKSEKKLYVAKDYTVELQDGDTIKINKSNAGIVMTKLRASKKLKKVYLNIESSSRVVVTEQDKKISEMFGGSYNPADSGYREVIDSLLKQDITKTKNQIIIDLPEISNRVNTSLSLTEKGYRIASPLTNSGQMLYDTAILKITKESINLFRSEQELQEMISCLRQAGKKFDIMPETISITEAVTKYL